MHPNNQNPLDDDREWDPSELHRSREPEKPDEDSVTEFEEFVDGDPIVERQDPDWDETAWPD